MGGYGKRSFQELDSGCLSSPPPLPLLQRRGYSFLYKAIDHRKEINIEIIVDPHRGLIDSDLPSQVGGCRDDHRITDGAPDGVLKVFDLYL